jgi:hypothetical protein
MTIPVYDYGGGSGGGVRENGGPSGKKTHFSSGNCVYNSLSNPVQTFVSTDLKLGLFGHVSFGQDLDPTESCIFPS